MALNLYCCLRHSHTNFLVSSHSSLVSIQKPIPISHQSLRIFFHFGGNPINVMSPSHRKANGSRCSCNGEIDGIAGDESFDLSCIHCNGSDSIKTDLSTYFSSDDSTKLRRIIVASIKGFSIGTGIKGGLALFSIVARFARRRSSSKSR